MKTMASSVLVVIGLVFLVVCDVDGSRVMPSPLPVCGVCKKNSDCASGACWEGLCGNTPDDLVAAGCLTPLPLCSTCKHHWECESSVCMGMVRKCGFYRDQVAAGCYALVENPLPVCAECSYDYECASSFCPSWNYRCGNASSQIAEGCLRRGSLRHRLRPSWSSTVGIDRLAGSPRHKRSPPLLVVASLLP